MVESQLKVVPTEVADATLVVFDETLDMNQFLLLPIELADQHTEAASRSDQIVGTRLPRLPSLRQG
jgi:hypothetical protein